MDILYVFMPLSKAQNAFVFSFMCCTQCAFPNEALMLNAMVLGHMGH